MGSFGVSPLVLRVVVVAYHDVTKILIMRDNGLNPLLLIFRAGNAAFVHSAACRGVQFAVFLHPSRAFTELTASANLESVAVPTTTAVASL